MEEHISAAVEELEKTPEELIKSFFESKTPEEFMKAYHGPDPEDFRKLCSFMYKHYKDKEISTGTELAQLAKREKPELLVFRFSGTPEACPYRAGFVGDIPKYPLERRELYKLLESPELGKILETRQLSRMRELFPGIKFHGTLETIYGGK